MFKDEYKAANENITPDKSVLESISARAAEELRLLEQTPPSVKLAKKRSSGKVITISTCAAACAAVVIISVAIGFPALQDNFKITEQAADCESISENETAFGETYAGFTSVPAASGTESAENALPEDADTSFDDCYDAADVVSSKATQVSGNSADGDELATYFSICSDETTINDFSNLGGLLDYYKDFMTNIYCSYADVERTKICSLLLGDKSLEILGSDFSYEPFAGDEYNYLVFNAFDNRTFSNVSLNVYGDDIMCVTFTSGSRSDCALFKLPDGTFEEMNAVVAASSSDTPSSALDLSANTLAELFETNTFGTLIIPSYCQYVFCSENGVDAVCEVIEISQDNAESFNTCTELISDAVSSSQSTHIGCCNYIYLYYIVQGSPNLVTVAIRTDGFVTVSSYDNYDVAYFSVDEDVVLDIFSTLTGKTEYPY